MGCQLGNRSPYDRGDMIAACASVCETGGETVGRIRYIVFSAPDKKKHFAIFGFSLKSAEITMMMMMMLVMTMIIPYSI